MKLAFYRGRSFISRAIRWFTRGEYSHVAPILPDGRIIEAWHNPSRVRFINHLGDGHARGTQVDVFSFDVPYPESATAFAESAVGMRYDFAGVLGFLTRRNSNRRNRVFCSELAMMVAKAGGTVLLQNVSDWKVSPSMLAMSPLLRFEGSVITRKTIGHSPVPEATNVSITAGAAATVSPSVDTTGTGDFAKRETKRIQR